MKKKYFIEEQEKLLREEHSAATRIFTHAEVDEMNRSRPIDDQLELDPLSGMLLHHCACPSCPFYLQNLQTPKDRAWNQKFMASTKKTKSNIYTSVRRNGLFRHLEQIYARPQRFEWKGFHRIVKRYLAPLPIRSRVAQLEKIAKHNKGTFMTPRILKIHQS